MLYSKYDGHAAHDGAREVMVRLIINFLRENKYFIVLFSQIVIK